ncbi:hypothetical protein IEQ34_019516 [Dendrobium chrysotoxum]|uniref:Uncharacterized protein n=1 Tax=Dendrobium chrysotoxum TaxID=161865 RepID=A0AAV7G7L0_DENCH|nr:hypothetical protein IEQ34_019516 [Dendrobium chrysotoxum]
MRTMMSRNTAMEGSRIGRRLEEEEPPLESDGGWGDARTLMYPSPVFETPSFVVLTSEPIWFLIRKQDCDEAK